MKSPLTKNDLGAQAHFLSGGGEMGQLIQSFDWSKTSLGTINSWSQNLLTSVNLCVNSCFPMVVWWGEELVKIYNNAYIPILGSKHPASLGKKGKEVWAEGWEHLGPVLTDVLQSGKPTWTENHSVLLNRRGYTEECYLTYSHSPIYNNQGEVEGAFSVVMETTEAIMNDRHMRTLQDLGKNLLGCKTKTDVYTSTLDTLKENLKDFPVAVIYEIDKEGLVLERVANYPDDLPRTFIPDNIDLAICGKELNMLADVIQSGKIGIYENISEQFGVLPSGQPGEPLSKFLVIPIKHSSQQVPYATLGVGLNPYIQADEKYLRFFQLIGEQVGAALSNVLAYEAEINTRKRIEESRAQIHHLIRQAPMGMAIYMGPNFIVEVANEKILELWGRTEEEVLNKPVLEAMADIQTPEIEAIMRRTYTTGKPFYAPEYYARIERNGIVKTLYINFTLEPLRDTKGEVIALMVVANDVTELVSSRKKIEENEERLRMAIDSTKLGTWDFNPVSGELSWSEECRKIYAIPEGEEVDFANFAQHIHPEDKGFVEEEIQKSMNPAGSGNYDITYRIFRFDDGSSRWIRAQGKVFFNKKQEAERSIGTVVDITENKEAQEKIIKSEQLFKSIVRSIPNSLVSLIDREYRFVLLEGDALDVFKIEHKDYKGMYAGDVFPRANFESSLFLYERAFAGEQFVIERERDERHFMVHFIPMKDESGIVENVLTVSMDITEIRVAQEKITRSEKLFKSVAISIPNSLIIVIDKNHRFLAIEGDIMEKMGYDARNYEGKHPTEVAPPERYEAMKHLYERVLSGEKFSEEQTSQTGDEFMLHFVPLRDEHEEVYAGLLVALDITTIKRAEKDMAKLAAIVQSSDDAIIGKTLNSVITSWNEGAERIFGYTAEEMIGQLILRLIPPERQNEEPAILERLKKGERVESFETQRMTKDKRLIDVSLTISPIKDAQGHVIGVSKIARDVTKQKHIERLIAENEERLRLAAESAELGTWNQNVATGEIISSEKNREIIGYKDDDWNREKFLKHVHPEDLKRVEKAFQKALHSGKLFYETRIIRDDKTQRWIKVNGTVIYDENQVPVTIMGTIMDITEQKLSLIELEESERRFKTMADTAPVMIWTINERMECDFLNKVWLDFTGRTLAQDLGIGWTESIHINDRAYCLEIVETAFIDRRPFSMEYRLKRYDGEYRWMLDEGIPRYSPDGTFVGYIGSCLDIQEQKMAKEELERKVVERTEQLKKRNQELQQQKEFAETLFDSSIDVMVVYDREARYMAFNKKSELSYGVKKEYVIGKKVGDAFPQLKDSSGFNDLQRALAGEYIHNKQYQSPVTKLYYDEFLIPLRTQDNEVYAVLVIGHDITENIEAAEQLRKTNEELMKSNHALEQFAYIASHDLQEPLRKIQVFSNMLEKNLHDEEATRKYFSKINSSAQRMAELIKAVLNYSRLSKPDEQFKEIDLNVVIGNVLTDFELLITDKNAVVDSDELPVIKGIPLQLNQLFSNLISNSLKFSKALPVITISSSIVSGEEIKHHLEAEPDREYVEIIFKDNGIGFEQKYATQIFTIFQRLNDKQIYAGTGIGLALCKKIVENHEGFITAQSELGQGATFYIYLPVS